MTSEELISTVKNQSVNVLRAAGGITHTLIWSVKDTAGYVCVISPEQGTIITIIPALHPNGSPCVMNGDKSGMAGTFSVKKSHLEQAMRLAGIEPLSMTDPDSPAFYLEDKKPRAWNYRWGLRLLTKGGTKTKTIAKTISFPEIQCPPRDILDIAKKTIEELQGWDAHLYLVNRDEVDLVEEWRI